MSTDAGPNTRPRQRGSFARPLLIGFAVLILLLLAAAVILWLARLPLANHLMKSEIEKAGLSLVEGRITRLDPDGARLQGLKASGGPLGEDMIEIAEIDLAYDIAGLRARHLDRVSISGLRLGLDSNDFRGGNDADGGTPRLPVTIGTLTIEDTELALTVPQGRLEVTVNGAFAGPQGGAFTLVAAPATLSSGMGQAQIASLRADLSLTGDGTARLTAQAQADGRLTTGSNQPPLDFNGAQLQLTAAAGDWRNLSTLMTEPWQGRLDLAIDQFNLPPLQTLPEITALAELLPALRAAGEDARLETSLSFSATPARAIIGTGAEDTLRLTTASGALLNLSAANLQTLEKPLVTYKPGALSFTAHATLDGGGLPALSQHIDGYYDSQGLKADFKGKIDTLTVGPGRFSDIKNQFILLQQGGVTALSLSGETAYDVDYADKGTLRGGVLDFDSFAEFRGADFAGHVIFNGDGCTSTGPIEWAGTATMQAQGAQLCLEGREIRFIRTANTPLTANGTFTAKADNVSVISGGHRVRSSQLGTTGRFRLVGYNLVTSLQLANQSMRYNDLLLLTDINTDATLRLNAGDVTVEAALKKMTVNDLIRPRRLGPVTVTGRARYGLDQMITAEGLASTLRGEPLAALSARHDLARNKGSAEARVTDLAFTPGGLQPQDIILPLTGVIADVDGTVSGQFDFAWEDGTLTSGGELTAVDTAFNSQAYPISGLNTTVRLKSLIPPATDGIMTATIGSLNIGTLLTGGAVSYELTETGDMRVPKLEWPWAGGVIGFYDTKIPAGSRDFTMSGRVAEIDLAELLTIIDMEGLTGTGAVSGALPIEVSDGAPYVRKGYLRTTKPGTLSYVNPATQSLGESGPGLLLQALENFEYELMEITIDGPLLGEMEAAVTLSGRNPEVQFGYPFRITISTQATIDDILKAARLGREDARSLLTYQEITPETAQEENP